MLKAIQLGIGTGMASLIFNAARTAGLRGQLALDVGIIPEGGGSSSVLPQGAPLVVTGHSLGGHLALLFGRFFPDVTEHVYTYNAPGIGPQGELALRLLGIPPSLPSLVTNVSAVGGTEAISRIWSKPGETIGIATEPGSRDHEHAMAPLTDTLALYGAFETLSPGLATDAAAVSGIISAASYSPEDSVEVVLDQLGALLDTGSAPVLIARTVSDLAARDDYYQKLYRALDIREPGRDYQIESLVGKSVDQIASMAGSDVSVRYALDELMPFHAKNADYGALEDRIFSGAWIGSRGEMLEGMLKNNLIDRPYGVTGSDDSIVYRDIDSGRRFSLLDNSQYQVALPMSSAPAERQRLLDYLDSAAYRRSVVFGSDSATEGDHLEGLSGGDRLFGGAGEDNLDGGSGDDYLEGGAENDVLLGGEGDDLLDGGAGADRLEGGPGNDSYIFGGALETDTIVDRDGYILVDGSVLTGGRGSAGGPYASADGQFTYALTGDLEGGTTLTVNGLLRIEDFHNGDLGIRLGNADGGEPPAPPGGTLLLGDYDYFLRLDDGPPPQLVGGDEFGNPNADGIAISHPDRVDTYERFPGTPGSTHFVAGGGDDIMQDMLGGDDWLELGTGDDFGWGGTGNDLVEGGSGRDIVAGGRGDDVLFANTRFSREADLDDSGVATLPAGGDLLSGGDGDDFIFGDAEANLIEGGSGDDHIFAGAGDDWIGADVSALAAGERYRIFPPNNDWVNREVDILWNPFVDLPAFQLGPTTPFGVPRQASINGRQISVGASPTDGDDFIDAGAGDDYIDPGAGMDTIFGGAGRDYVASWFGDSIGDDIDAGEGDDFVVDMASGGNRLDGGGGNDYIQAGIGSDLLVGGEGDDRIFSFGGDDIVLAGAGNDTVRVGGSGDKLVAGGLGNDRMIAATQDSGGSATFFWGPGDGNDMGLLLGGRGMLQIGVLGQEQVSVRYVTGVATGEFVVEDQPEARGSGFEFSIGGGGEKFLLLEVPDFFASADMSVRFADGTIWDDAHLRALATAPGAPADPIGISGSDADDISYGSQGADRFVSSRGNDWFLGGAGDDLYQYASGDGFDQIEDSDGGLDTLRFATGIGTGNVGVFAAGADYILAVGEGGVRIRGGRTPGNRIERVDFSDGTRWSPADLEARAEVLPDNRAPTVPSSFGGVSVDPGAQLQVVLPADAIADPDRFDSVSLFAITADGEKLPDWLHFDASSRTLAGTPSEQDAGVHELLVIAADTNGAAAVSGITIAVGEELPAPEQAIPGQDPPQQAPTLVTEQATQNASPPAAKEIIASDAPAPQVTPAPIRRDDAFSTIAAAPPASAEPPRLGEPVDPAFREVQHSMDFLLQTGRANLGERYAEAIREFEERRLQREEAPPPPPPTDEEIQAWNAAMHTWNDRNPGFGETDLGGNDGTWTMGWGLPGPVESTLGGTAASLISPGLANPSVLGRFQGAAPAPSLSEGMRNVR